MRDEARLSEMLGKVMVRVENTGDEVVFEAESGEKWMLYHEQDCCERVKVEEVVGELEWLVGKPLTMAEEVSSEGWLDETRVTTSDSETWTFYKFATIKGYVTIRWLGSSNEYYSERVDFARC